MSGIKEVAGTITEDIKGVAAKIGLTEGAHPTSDTGETGINKYISTPLGLNEGPHPDKGDVKDFDLGIKEGPHPDKGDVKDIDLGLTEGAHPQSGDLRTSIM